MMTPSGARAVLYFIHVRTHHQPDSQLGPHHFTDVTIETTVYVDHIGNGKQTKTDIANTKREKESERL